MRIASEGSQLFLMSAAVACSLEHPVIRVTISIFSRCSAVYFGAGIYRGVINTGDWLIRACGMYKYNSEI